MSSINYKVFLFEDLSIYKLYAILRLRQEVFVVEQDCPYLDADGNDQFSLHLLGYDDQEVLQSYARILPSGISYPNHASIGRIVTAPACRGTGEGARIVGEAIAACQSQYAAHIKISAQVYAKAFYEKLGFHVVGEEYLEDDIPHVGMVLDTA